MIAMTDLTPAEKRKATLERNLALKANEIHDLFAEASGRFLRALEILEREAATLRFLRHESAGIRREYKRFGLEPQTGLLFSPELGHERISVRVMAIHKTAKEVSKQNNRTRDAGRGWEVLLRPAAAIEDSPPA